MASLAIKYCPFCGKPLDKDAEPIEDIVARIASKIPEEEWEKLPKDLTDNLDHYLYGVDKEE